MLLPEEFPIYRQDPDFGTPHAELSEPQPTLHDLRHSHASMLIAMDFTVVDVQRRLGHRKPDTTLRVYAHQWKFREAQRSEAGSQIGRLIAGEAAKALARPTLALPRGGQ